MRVFKEHPGAEIGAFKASGLKETLQYAGFPPPGPLLNKLAQYSNR